MRTLKYAALFWVMYAVLAFINTQLFHMAFDQTLVTVKASFWTLLTAILVEKDK